MKIRIYKRLVNGVFEIRVQTEDWSENDRRLMVKYGEPLIDIGGTFARDNESDASGSSDSSDEPTSVHLDSQYVRVLSESPFVQHFDLRDYGTEQIANALATAWSLAIESRIMDAVRTLRERQEFFSTETVTEF